MFRMLILVRSRYDAMPSSQQFWVLFNLFVDVIIAVFLCMMIYQGIESDINAFYFWVPFLSFVLWKRYKMTLERLSS